MLLANSPKVLPCTPRFGQHLSDITHRLWQQLQLGSPRHCGKIVIRNLINLNREESLHGRGNHCALYKVGALSLSTSLLDSKSVSTGLLTSSNNGDLNHPFSPSANMLCIFIVSFTQQRF